MIDAIAVKEMLAVAIVRRANFLAIAEVVQADCTFLLCLNGGFAVALHGCRDYEAVDAFLLLVQLFELFRF